MNHDTKCLKPFWYHFDGRNTRAKILFETTAYRVHLYSIHPSLARHLALRIPSFHNFTHLEPAELKDPCVEKATWLVSMRIFQPFLSMFSLRLSTHPFGTYCIFSHFLKKKSNSNFTAVFQGGLIWFKVTIVALPKVQNPNDLDLWTSRPGTVESTLKPVAFWNNLFPSPAWKVKLTHLPNLHEYFLLPCQLSGV